MGKTERFTNSNVDLERLATRVSMYLQENGFEVAYSKDPTAPPSWYFIQARKLSAIRSIAGARRSTDITIRGKPSDFEVTISTGEWGKNLLSSAPLFVVPIIGAAATVAKLYVGKKFESNIWKYIKDQVMFLNNSMIEKEVYASKDQRVYNADYVEGYRDWKEIVNGKLILERNRDGSNNIIFTSSKGEITIPAKSIEKAEIISRRKGLHENDLMIQLLVKQDSKDQTIVFNVNDDIITGIFAGINELVNEDKGLKSVEHTIVSDTKYCIKCGKDIPKEARFCYSCGAPQT
jgi:hypothetical protein